MGGVAEVSVELARPIVRKERSQLQRAFAVLRQDPGAVLGGVLFILIVLVSLLAPVLAPFDPNAIRPDLRLVSPGTGPYLLGGDELGRDVLSRILWGSRTSLLIAFIPVLIGSTVGTTLGVLAGFYGGKLDDLIMRLLEVFLAFPPILLALGIAAAIGPGTGNLIISLSIITVPFFARVLRASTLSVREQDFVLAAVSLGSKPAYIIVHHIFRNIVSPVIVLATLQGARVILMGAGLSFLGLGVRPPHPDWGSMLSAGQQLLSVAPHIAMVPGLAIFVVTLSLNLLGDGLRDALDPRLRNQ